MNENFKKMNLSDLLDELVDCGREKQMYPDSGRGDTTDTNVRINAIKKEITNRFYKGEKFD
jgi:hypothetical protein